MTTTKQLTTKSSSNASSMAELMAKSSGLAGLKKGDIVEGTVKKLTPQEILLEIGAKSDALVIEYDKQNLENLLNLLHVGDKVKASVISPESEDGFPVVSLRRTLDDLLYSGFESHFSQNEVIKVRVADTTKGGYFVENELGIRGFLPNSQTMNDSVSVGDTIEVKIIEFDKSKKRVIFSQKAVAYTSTISEIEQQVKRGESYDALIETVTPYGLYVTFSPKKGSTIEGFIHISEISYQRVENISQDFKKGDKITAQVLDIDRENRRVNLSIKNLQKDTFGEVKERYPIDKKIKVIIKDSRTRGVTVTLDDKTEGFIPAQKIASSTTYLKGDALEVEVSDYDEKRRLIIVSPVLKEVPIGYR